MKRILIIGCGGSGKSTLAIKMGEKLNLPVVHLDKIFWTGNWVNVSEEEFDKKLNEELVKESWIIDGNYERTLDLRISYADTIIYLDYSTLTSLLGVFKRVNKYRGTTREDIGGDCIEKYDTEFLLWVLKFNKTYRKKFHKKLASLSEQQVIILKNRRECNKFLKGLNV